MKRIVAVFALLLVAFGASAQEYVKIMSYNVRNAKGMDNVRDYRRVAKVILEAAPDIVAVQELDSMTNRSGQKHVLGELGIRFPAGRRRGPFWLRSSMTVCLPAHIFPLLRRTG